jgi:tRNA threonylcarbamoyladenosine biosynthesis protein TsaB
VSAFDRVLIIETAGRIGQVALAAGDAVVAEARLGEARKRASDLALVVNRLLKGQGWPPRELTAVVAGLGPGSYTGLRVGLASAKALAYATGCAFFGVETFAAIAERQPSEVDAVSVIADALQGKLFRRDYRRTASREWEPAGRMEIVAASEWLSSVRPVTWVSGPALGMLASQLPPEVRVASADDRDPRALDLFNVAKKHPWAVTTDMWTAEPLYLRGSSAEEKVAVSAGAPGKVAADQ